MSWKEIMDDLFRPLTEEELIEELEVVVSSCNSGYYIEWPQGDDEAGNPILNLDILEYMNG